MRPSPSVHHRGRAPLCPPGVPQSLETTPYVYVRVDAVRRPLVRPYEGPFLVLRRAPKTFDISRAGKSWTVSVDCLKPAWGFDSSGPPSPSVLPPATSGTTPLGPAPSVPAPAAPALFKPAAATERLVLDKLPLPAAPVLPSHPSYSQVLRSGRVSRPPPRFNA